MCLWPTLAGSFVRATRDATAGTLLGMRLGREGDRGGQQKQGGNHKRVETDKQNQKVEVGVGWMFGWKRTHRDLFYVACSRRSLVCAGCEGCMSWSNIILILFVLSLLVSLSVCASSCSSLLVRLSSSPYKQTHTHSRSLARSHFSFSHSIALCFLLRSLLLACLPRRLSKPLNGAYFSYDSGASSTNLHPKLPIQHDRL